MASIKRAIAGFVFVVSTTACSPLYDYVARGNNEPWDTTTVYRDQNRVSLSLSGMDYYLNQSPKVHQFVMRIEGKELAERLVIRPLTVKLDITHQGRSLLGVFKEKVSRVYSSAKLCGKIEHPDRIRTYGLPREIPVPAGCNFDIRFRYFLELPVTPDELMVNVEFEYRTESEQVKVSESIKLYLDRKTFLWVYAT